MILTFSLENHMIYMPPPPHFLTYPLQIYCILPFPIQFIPPLFSNSRHIKLKCLNFFPEQTFCSRIVPGHTLPEPPPPPSSLSGPAFQQILHPFLVPNLPLSHHLVSPGGQSWELLLHPDVFKK